jgi:hypothetical protein
MIDYNPKEYQGPIRLADVPTAWRGIEKIIVSIIQDFGIGTKDALEFGVDYGFSTSALANFFEAVIGVDTFDGDVHAGPRDHLLEQASNALKDFENIYLEKSSYQDYIQDNDMHFNLIHIDIIHTYEDTYACGKWAVEHADVVIFHDTESFADVRRAVEDLSKEFGREFYNYKPHHGLGIISKNKIK